MTDNPYNHPYAVPSEEGEFHSFTPRFEKPVIAEGKIRNLHEPYKSRSELTPIQLAIDLPPSRLGYPESTPPLSFNFIVKQQRIMVYPEKFRRADGKEIDWYTVLNENERLAVFNYILAEYRSRAYGNDGFRVAAIGVTEDNELFIASNTRPSNQLYKKCAETSVIAAAIEAAKKAKEEGYGEKLKSDKPKVLFKDFIVMAGKEASNINIACPCGPCTDELYDHMALKGEDRNNLRKRGNIYVLPCVPETARDANGLFSLQTPKVNSRAQNLGDLDKGNECWKVTPEDLYRGRSVTVTRAAKHAQISALDDVLGAKMTPSQCTKETFTHFTESLANNEAESAPIDGAAKGINGNMILTLSKALRDNLTAIPTTIQKKLKTALQTAANYLNGRNSIAELDMTTSQRPDGVWSEPNFEDLNRFMVERINDALIPRVQALREKGEFISPGNLGKFIPSVRCAVLQLKDGTFTYGVEVKSVNDPSMPSAEFNALGRVVEAFGRVAKEKPGEKAKPEAKVARMWVMEMSPKYIKEGQIPTPLKDNLERITKRCDDPYMLNVTMIPYNDGSHRMTRENTEVRALQEIYPNMWAGNHTIMPFTPAMPAEENGTDQSLAAQVRAEEGSGPANLR